VPMTVPAQGLVSMNSAQAGAYVRFSNNVSRAWLQNEPGAQQGSIGFFNAALYWADPSSPDAWHIVASLATLGSGATAGLIVTSSGGGARTVLNPNTTPRVTPTLFQLRVWNGPYTTWEDAIASGDSRVLLSGDRWPSPYAAPIVTATPSVASGLPATIIAWGGNAANPILVVLDIPEPGMLALTGLALTGLILIRRRR
jgi:hypothetical protein